MERKQVTLTYERLKQAAISKRKDLTGKRFGKLVVLKHYWKGYLSDCLCQCDCGKTKIIRAVNLKTEVTKSCGCAYKRKRTKNELD
jgi:hypothetical protein